MQLKYNKKTGLWCSKIVLKGKKVKVLSSNINALYRAIK